MIAGRGVADPNLANLRAVNGNAPSVLSRAGAERPVRLLVCNKWRIGEDLSVGCVAIRTFGLQRVEECRCRLARSLGKQNLSEIGKVDHAPHVETFEEHVTEEPRLALEERH